MRQRGKTLAFTIGLLGAAAVVQPRPAHAGAFYVETGIGVAELHSADAFLADAAPAGGALNLGVNLGVFRTFVISDTMEFHFGLQTRYDSGSANGDYFTVLTPYAVARFQFTIFYAEAGYSPYLWKRIAASSGLNSLTDASAFAYMGEAGILWPITPKFSMGLAATSQWISSGGTVSPSPILEGTWFMRFYFGYSGGSSSSARDQQYSTEWKGWRYPFGREMQ